MSSVIAALELISTAATDLANIGSKLSAANAAAAATTATVPAAAADQVSAGVAQLLSAHAQEYQALAGQVEAFHQQFTQNVRAGAGAYASAEAANAAVM
jgi:PE family